MKANLLILLLVAGAASAACGKKVIKDGDTLVFMGDSITKYGESFPHGYLHLVDLGLAANGINATWHGVGVCGHTANQMKKRFKHDVIDKHPDVVTIFAGVNDCWFGWPSNTNSTPADVAAMADMAIKAGIRPVLLSPTTCKTENFLCEVQDYAKAVKAIAKERSIPYAETYEVFRSYIDSPNSPPINSSRWKTTADGTHMEPIGNRLLAVEVLKAFGLDRSEIDKAETAWNAKDDLCHFHPKVMVTEEEYTAVKVAAAKAGKPLATFHRELFLHGVELLKKQPSKVPPSNGANKTLSASFAVSFPVYDDMLDCSRGLTDGKDSLDYVSGYAMLAGVHDLPPATENDMTVEPAQHIDKSAFAKSIEFTVSGFSGTSTLTNFPVAVRLSADSPNGFRYADMANPSQGDEIRFADDKGNSFPYEIENWNTGGNSILWVRIPELAKGTKFAMYYGGKPEDTVNPLRTWAADYIGVWHMAEACGAIADSTGNGLVAKPTGTGSSQPGAQVAAPGVIGNGRVSATSTKIMARTGLCVADNTMLDLGGTFTMSGWIKVTDSTGYSPRIFSRKYQENTANGWDCAISKIDVLSVSVSSGCSSATGTPPSASNGWIHVCSVYNGPRLSLYVNGVLLLESEIETALDNNEDLIFGYTSASYAGHFTGIFDEYRLRKAACSADWVKAEYDQSSASFLASEPVR